MNMNTSTKLLFAFSLGTLLWGSVCAAQEYEFRNGYPNCLRGRKGGSCPASDL